MKIFDLTPDQFWSYLERIEKTFVVPDDYREIRDLKLFDLAGPEVAKTRGLDDIGKGIRMGFPEVTAEMVGVYRATRQAFIQMNKKNLADKANISN
ncbi:MAG: hypothetical protein IH795_09855 [Bacteroidetes bacterium]|nr:hypothetical protein [Bacteroidota bacterium]